jgi:hypothetical protein
MGVITKQVENERLANYDDHVIDLPTPQVTGEHQVNGQLSKKDLTMFHQNIRGLAINKIDDISVYLHTSPIHVLCMSEHHLAINEIETIRLLDYNLSAKFCRNTFKKRWSLYFYA